MEHMTCKKCRKEKPDDGLLCCETCRQKRRERYNKDKAKENEQSRLYHAKNRDRLNAKHIEYSKNHREEINEYRRKRYHESYKHDKRFMLDGAFSKSIRKELKRKKLRKLVPWEKLLGYTVEDLMLHLEARFKPGMTWENYGTYWHVDHIKPKSWFEYESTEDCAFKDCWALNNLQPLEGIENSKKGNRYEG